MCKTLSTSLALLLVACCRGVSLDLLAAMSQCWTQILFYSVNVLLQTTHAPMCIDGRFLREICFNPFPTIEIPAIDLIADHESCNVVSSSHAIACYFYNLVN